MTQPKNDSFFQLSLTELAFILIFVVLLLIGAKFAITSSEATKCETALNSCTVKATECAKEKDACYKALAKGGADPQKVIDSLVNMPELKKENEELKDKAKELEDKLKAYDELKNKIPDPARAKTAEDFLSSYENGTKKKVAMDDAKKAGEETARLAKDLEDCRGQLKYCSKVSASKGFGFPPCWTDASGQIQYLLDIEIRPDGLAVERAWPPEREEDARQLPGLQNTLDAGLQSLDQFKANTRAIFEMSKKTDPECRHFVILRRAPSERDVDHFNRLRLGVEDHFYKLDRTFTASDKPVSPPRRPPDR